jgi:hypothetical protein
MVWSSIDESYSVSFLDESPGRLYVHPAVTRITLISSWVCWPDWPPDDMLDIGWSGYTVMDVDGCLLSAQEPLAAHLDSPA